LSLPVQEVAKFFVQRNIFTEITQSKKFILTSLDDELELFEFKDFMSIFVRGILRDILCSLAHSIEKFKRKEEIELEEQHGIAPA